jgi:hypothetical protein
MIAAFTASDTILIVCCALAAFLALSTDTIMPSRRRTVVAVMLLSCAIGALNLALDAGFTVPPRRFLVAALYIAGASKGFVLGWLSALLLFKQLRREPLIELPAS